MCLADFCEIFDACHSEVSENIFFVGMVSLSGSTPPGCQWQMKVHRDSLESYPQTLGTKSIPLLTFTTHCETVFSKANTQELPEPKNVSCHPGGDWHPGLGGVHPNQVIQVVAF